MLFISVNPKYDQIKTRSLHFRFLPNTGMASETCGRVSVTRLWKTVNESSMVTPAGRTNTYELVNISHRL